MLPNSDCIFCKIVEGAIPSTKLFEDDSAIAILDINPITFGHSLYISKGHYATLLDVPEGKLGGIVKNLQKVVSALLKATGCEGFNIIQNNQRCAGQLVPHLHFHLVPRKPNDPIRFNWQIGTYQKDQSQKLAADIKKALGK
ncbi:MAG TPA: HIT family protein [Planctomycetota bacterium]|nr:HIT family protein [Planctomycetota bacterium]